MIQCERRRKYKMYDIMWYKGYWTRARYSEEDNCFFGEIEGIRDSITFEGNTMEELRKDFEEAIDDYIDHCERYNKEPQEQSYLP